jgi:hypothetical protein
LLSIHKTNNRAAITTVGILVIDNNQNPVYWADITSYDGPSNIATYAPANPGLVFGGTPYTYILVAPGYDTGNTVTNVTATNNDYVVLFDAEDNIDLENISGTDIRSTQTVTPHVIYGTGDGVYLGNGFAEMKNISLSDGDGQVIKYRGQSVDMDGVTADQTRNGIDIEGCNSATLNNIRLTNLRGRVNDNSSVFADTVNPTDGVGISLIDCSNVTINDPYIQISSQYYGTDGSSRFGGIWITAQNQPVTNITINNPTIVSDANTNFGNGVFIGRYDPNIAGISLETPNNIYINNPVFTQSGSAPMSGVEVSSGTNVSLSQPQTTGLASYVVGTDPGSGSSATALLNPTLLQSGYTTQNGGGLTLLYSGANSSDLTLSANPSTIPYGGATTLSWNALNVVDGTCGVFGPSTFNYTGGNTTGTATAGALYDSTTYTFTCTGEDGTTQSTSATVTVTGGASD